MFSCSLAAEDETALSIIDPVTVTMELANNPLFHQKNTKTAGLLDVHGDENKPPILEVSVFYNNKARPFLFYGLQTFLGCIQCRDSE